MGRVEQRLYRQQMARRRLGRMVVLMLLICGGCADSLSQRRVAPDSGDDCAADRHADCRRL